METKEKDNKISRIRKLRLTIPKYKCDRYLSPIKYELSCDYKIICSPSEIIDNLLLGSLDDAIKLYDNENLIIINVAKGCNKFVDEENKKIGQITPNYYWFPISDSIDDSNMCKYLKDIVAIINEHHSKGKKILVHCREGISRSPTIVIAYIMKKMNMDYDSAYEFVLQKRKCISPNFGFIILLREFEKYLSELNIT